MEFLRWELIFNQFVNIFGNIIFPELQDEILACLYFDLAFCRCIISPPLLCFFLVFFSNCLSKHLDLGFVSIYTSSVLWVDKKEEDTLDDLFGVIFVEELLPW
jgi:hypothetical protein